MLLVDTKVEVKYKDGGVRMERIPKGLYTKEFKEEAVKMVIEGGLKVPEVGRRLSIAKSTIAYWVKLAKEGTLLDDGRQKLVTREQMEVSRLKREVAELRMERDIFKNAPGCTLPRSR